MGMLVLPKSAVEIEATGIFGEFRLAFAWPKGEECPNCTNLFSLDFDVECVGSILHFDLVVAKVVELPQEGIVVSVSEVGRELSFELFWVGNDDVSVSPLDVVGFLLEHFDEAREERNRVFPLPRLVLAFFLDGAAHVVAGRQSVYSGRNEPTAVRKGRVGLTKHTVRMGVPEGG